MSVGPPESLDEFIEAMAAPNLTVVVKVAGVPTMTAVPIGTSYVFKPGGLAMGTRPWNIFDQFDPPLGIEGLKKGLYLLNGVYEAEAAMAAQEAIGISMPSGVSAEKFKMQQDAMAMLITATVAEALNSHMEHPTKPGVGHPSSGVHGAEAVDIE